MTAEEEAALDEAWEALETGALADALRLATALGRAHPEEEEIGELLARAEAATGALEGALSRLASWEKRAALASWPLVARADLLLRAHPPDSEAALKALKVALKRARGDHRAEAEVAWMEGVALTMLEEDVRALACLDRALERAPEHADARLDRGLLRFELGRFALAKEDLSQLTTAPLEFADAWHTLGLIAERAGDQAAARKAFARATLLDPEAFPVPIGLSEADFDAVVHDAIARLPETARAQMDNVLVTVAPIPSEEDLDGGALSPTMLGIFKGTPHGARSVSSHADHATAHIVLFQKNLERATRSKEELIEQIGITVAHEVGHLLGLDEEDLEERGLD
jgi:predicted Zn-dependent protease with MMP-like domain/thioredoxin-like negative regulator of GroEL